MVKERYKERHCEDGSPKQSRAVFFSYTENHREDTELHREKKDVHINHALIITTPRMPLEPAPYRGLRLNRMWGGCLKSQKSLTAKTQREKRKVRKVIELQYFSFASFAFFPPSGEPKGACASAVKNFSANITSLRDELPSSVMGRSRMRNLMRNGNGNGNGNGYGIFGYGKNDVRRECRS